jgi:hypothetical protein
LLCGRGEAGARRACAPNVREHYPPTSAGDQTYTLLKFYNLSCDLVKAVLSSMAENEVEFPFRWVAGARGECV